MSNKRRVLSHYPFPITHSLHPTGFSPDFLDAPLAPLDELPRGLWLQGMVNSVGALPARLRGLLALRAALLAGELPEPASREWPASPADGPFLDKLSAIELPRYCKHREDVTDQVIRALLWHSDRIIDYLGECTLEEAVRRAADAFAEEWRIASEELDELLYVFGVLGDVMKGERWALVRGLLHSEGWREVLRMRSLLESMPELRAVIRSLGRARQSEDLDQEHRPQVEVMEKVLSLRPRTRETHIPEVPVETRGVQRSGRIARMLPSEAALLRHPRLRLIWFARHAERTLLTYEDDDRVRETVQTEASAWRSSVTPQPRRKLEMGPMILCVDTSASMSGTAEQVAKATVLEAMRTAAAQKRRCYAYAFSGPEEIVERELALNEEGIANAISFLTQSFHGGTDIDEPLRRALKRIHEEAWQLADLVIASDGQFACTPEMTELLRRAKEEAGLRVQGILIADRETVGMLEVCNAIFRVQDWRKLGEGSPAQKDGESLALRYFPGVFAKPQG